MTRQLLVCDERGQSEVISFAIVLALAVVVFGVVLAVGLPAIDDAQAEEASVTAEYNLAQLEGAIQQTTGNGTGTTLDQTIPSGEYRHQENATQIAFAKGGDNRTAIRSDGVRYRGGEGGKMAYETGLMATADSRSTAFHRLPDTAPGLTAESIYQSPELGTEVVGWEVFAMDFDRGGGISGGRGQTMEYFVTPRGPGSSYTTLTSEEDDVVEIRVRTQSNEMWVSYLELHPAFGSVTQTGGEITAELEVGVTLSLIIYEVDIRIRG